jgi:serine/threonine-protein kinase
MNHAKRIGKYPVIREIGEGAVGTVYEAFDPDTGEKVAIKILREEHLADSRADSPGARFEREAQATRRLRHPNIVTVHEYGEQGRIRYIVMEFVKGRELRALLRERGRFGLEEAFSILSQLLDALAHSHRCRVVHRDIKPSNLMIGEALHVKVMDFGIARIPSAAFTQMGTMLGTPAYMSPEQMRGEPADGRADLWAAGTILYELLVGRSPFAGANGIETMMNAANNEPVPVSSLVPGLPAALDAVLARALAKRREERYQEAGDFARDLIRLVAGTTGALDLELGGAAAPIMPDPNPRRSAP